MMVICSAPFTYTVQIRTMVHYKRAKVLG